MAALLHTASYSSRRRGGGKNARHGEMSGLRRVTNHPLTPVYQGTNMAKLATASAGLGSENSGCMQNLMYKATVLNRPESRILYSDLLFTSCRFRLIYGVYQFLRRCNVLGNFLFTLS